MHLLQKHILGVEMPIPRNLEMKLHCTGIKANLVHSGSVLALLDTGAKLWGTTEPKHLAATRLEHNADLPQRERKCQPDGSADSTSAATISRFP